MEEQKLEKCSVCGNEYKNLAVHMRLKHGDSSVPTTIPTADADILVPPAPSSESSSLEKAVIGLTRVVSDLSVRMEKMEKGTSGDEFKVEAKSEDILNAKSTRESVDPRIVKIVDEVLGEDFGIEIEPRGDNPGFLFNILVPRRLSDVEESTRPVMGPDGKYKRTETGEAVEETYWPGDKRSRMIASHQSYDAIREHAMRVRAYIVSYFQKMRQPIPEFKLKSNVY